MTKFFIAMVIGCGLMIPTQAFAKTTKVHHTIKKEIVKKPLVKKLIKEKKSAVKNSKKLKRNVVSLDFSKKEKRSVDFKKVQIVKAKNLPKKSLVKGRKVASLQKTKPAPKPMTVAQLKKTTKPYWAAYCKDGIVLNSHVYCALKNPQKNGLKAAKQTRVAASRDLEAKKRK